MEERNTGKILLEVLKEISIIICKDYQDRHGWQLTKPADVDAKLDLTQASFYRIDDTIYLIHGATPYVYVGDYENKMPAGVYLSWMEHTCSNHLVLGTNELVGAISQDMTLSNIMRELIKPPGKRYFDIVASTSPGYPISFSKDRFQKLLHEIELWKANKLVYK